MNYVQDTEAYTLEIPFNDRMQEVNYRFTSCDL